MTGYIARAFANVFLTFSLSVLPLLAYSVLCLDAKERSVRRTAARLPWTGVTVFFFFLFLYSVYHTVRYKFLRIGSDVFFYLFVWEHCKKFLRAVLVINICIIAVLKYGKIDIRRGRTNISKEVFALVSVPLFLIFGSIRFRQIYGIVPVEQLIFHLMMPETGANFSIVYKLVITTAIDIAASFILLTALLSIKVTFKQNGRTLCFPRFSTGKKLQRITAVFFAVFGAVFFFVNMGFPSYIASRNQMPSTFYEEHYIDPKSVEITFPEKKRNLIVIFIESLETGFLNREDGGAFSERLMPGVEKLARENINFSASAVLGGAYQLTGTSWTIAGITAQYSGVPLNLGFEGNSYGSLLKKFLPGAFCLGDILREAGYTSYFFLGSEIEFGGRDKYFATHKNTVIYDYHYFVDNGYIPKNYRVWWGFEDRKLYGFAKEKIPEIAGEEPFFITLLTVDTHPNDGYLDGDAVKIFDAQYKNVLFDADKQLADFLEWLKEQPFYENTTVAVLGDHLYMDYSFFPEDFNKGGANRFPCNIFINSSLSGEHTKNRQFSHFDMFPALVDSVGGVYDAPGLGLGRSMNKGEPTLLESLGVDAVNKALGQKSEYYNKMWTGKNDE